MSSRSQGTVVPRDMDRFRRPHPDGRVVVDPGRAEGSTVAMAVYSRGELVRIYRGDAEVERVQREIRDGTYQI